MLTALDLEPHRAALMGHCYHMLGSTVDADDAVQETMIRAWKARERFEGRASVRTWLYTIASRVCLDALSDRTRRTRPMALGPAGTVDDALTQRDESHWLEPVPDALAVPAEGDPAQRALLRESIRLAFVAALQYLPPKQRVVLLLMEVLGWSAAEVAESLELSVAAVNSALQRARATLAQRGQRLPSGTLSDADASLLDRYVDAFERYDIDALTSLLREDATLSMPPYSLWLQGHEPIRQWLLGHGIGCRGSRLIPTRASGSPAFGQYRPRTTPGISEGTPGDGGYEPWALVVLEVEGDRITGWNSFLDTARLFPRFGLPPQL